MEQDRSVKGPIVSLPFIFGGASLLALVGYQAQRSGAFLGWSNSLNRFIQHHLDAIGIFAMAAAFCGVISGLLILQFRGRSNKVTLGMGISLIALLWSGFGLSL